MAEERQGCLDGWRAISILLVLATHMLPVGPKGWQLNDTTGRCGMALFFTLSGFLITRQLQLKRDVTAFFLRRLFRILPLAWLVIVLVFVWQGGSARAMFGHLFFLQTTFHSIIQPSLGHFWSLCVEVQFYLFMGLMLSITHFRGFWLLPWCWLVMVTIRGALAPSGTIETQFRVDEILSGACLALVYRGDWGRRVQRALRSLPLLVPLALLALASHPSTVVLHPLRGLAASLAVGHTMLRADEDHRAYGWLSHRVLRYVATTSYALYVLHPFSMYGWLGTGETPAVKYARRLLCFAISFAAAHLSTFHLEKYFIAMGKELASGGAIRFTRLSPRHGLGAR